MTGLAQFDVYENPDRDRRKGYPYLVVLQSALFDHYTTRLVMPLARLARTPAALPRRLAETVMVGGEALHLAAHLCAPLPARLLRKPVASLREHAHAICDALDAVISGV